MLSLYGGAEIPLSFTLDVRPSIMISIWQKIPLNDIQFFTKIDRKVDLNHKRSKCTLRITQDCLHPDYAIIEVPCLFLTLRQEN